MKESDLIYIAGFFDGEGCICGRTCNGSKLPRVKIIIGQKKPEILYWIKETLEMGSVRTSFIKRCSRWEVCNKKHVGKFISLILPYSKVKREELIVGQELNDLTKNGQKPTDDNRQRRMILFNQLKSLKRR